MQHAGWVQELGETRSKVGQQQQMRSDRLWEAGSCGPLAPHQFLVSLLRQEATGVFEHRTSVISLLF